MSEFESRGSSPNPVQSRLNANAPPFIPGSTADDPGSGNENNDPAESVREHHIATREEQPTSFCDSAPLESEVQAEGNSVPVQTVGVPTPSLPSQSGESDATCREVQQAAPEAVKSPHSNSSGTQNQPPLTHTSPSHPLPSSSTVLTVLSEATGRPDSMHDPPTTSHPSHNPQGTHHTDTSTAAHKPKTWASIVRKNGSGSSHVATPTTCTAVHNAEENKVERKELVREEEGAAKEEEKEEEITSSVNASQPSAHLRSLGGKVSPLR